MISTKEPPEAASNPVPETPPIFSECPAATLSRHAPRRRRGSGLAHGRPRAAGPTTRTRTATLAAYNKLSTGVPGRILLPPAPTRHTVGPTSDNHPTPQPAGHSARRPREPSGSATWAPRRDRGGQTPTRRLQRTTQLPFLNRVSNDSPCTGLPGPPLLTYCSVFVFVRVFVCMSVRIFARCRMYA